MSDKDKKYGMSDGGLGEKPLDLKPKKPLMKTLKALHSGSHQIGDKLYVFKEGETLSVPKAHYNVLIKLPIFYLRRV